MLSTLDHPTSSSTSVASSPRFSPRFSPRQYAATTSPSLRVINTTSRRRSQIPSSPAPAPAPTRVAVDYVDKGTQYSPPTVKMGPSSPTSARGRNPPPSTQSENTAPTAVAAAAAAPPTMVKSVVDGDSPSMKKRASPHEIRTNVSDPVIAKRAKEAQPAVKLLPAKYELCEVGDIVILIANMIAELIETNDALPLRSGVLTRFHSRTPPGISVMDYLQRLAKHATLTPPILLSMVYYIDRLCSLYPAFTITTLTVHRFLITAATVAAKGLSDSFWNNATYARVGGIKIAELCMLELDFLYRVDWRIVPNPEVLVDYYRGLVERSDLYELADDMTSDEDDGLDEENDSPGASDIKSEGGSATDVKWKAWMDDVSKKGDAPDDVPKENAVKVEASEEKMRE